MWQRAFNNNYYESFKISRGGGGSSYGPPCIVNFKLKNYLVTSETVNFSRLSSACPHVKWNIGRKVQDGEGLSVASTA